MRNIVLGTVNKLEYPKLDLFLKSLRKHAASDTEVRLFVANTSEASIQKIRASGAEVQPFPFYGFRGRQPMLLLWPLWKRMLASRDLGGKCALGKRVFSLFTLRSVLAYEFLAARKGAYRNVLLTDVRDVVFQRDPFSHDHGPGLHCFLEDPRMIIGTCRHNTAMIMNTVGAQVFDELKDRRVSCAGTVMGDAESILAYLRKMIERFCIAGNIGGGNDQGVHNYLLHTNQLTSCSLHQNGEGAVYTAGATPIDEIPLNADDEIVRADGGVIPVIHQYDRHPILTEKYRAKFDIQRPLPAGNGSVL